LMQKRNAVYLDASAGGPLRQEALQACQEFLRSEATNPSSPHQLGRRAKAWLVEAKEEVFRSLGLEAASVSPQARGQLYLTSSGTEANQWVIHSVLEKGLNDWAHSSSQDPPHWILTSVEHESVRLMVDGFLSR